MRRALVVCGSRVREAVPGPTGCVRMRRRRYRRILSVGRESNHSGLQEAVGQNRTGTVSKSGWHSRRQRCGPSVACAKSRPEAVESHGSLAGHSPDARHTLTVDNFEAPKSASSLGRSLRGEGRMKYAEYEEFAQSHINATSKPPQSVLIANRLRVQSHPKAPTMRLYCDPKATPKRGQSGKTKPLERAVIQAAGIVALGKTAAGVFPRKQRSTRNLHESTPVRTA